MLPTIQSLMPETRDQLESESRAKTEIFVMLDALGVLDDSVIGIAAIDIINGQIQAIDDRDRLDSLLNRQADFFSELSKELNALRIANSSTPKRPR